MAINPELLIDPKDSEADKFNTFNPPSKDDIRVGYISTDRGYVSGLSVCEANEYAKNDPGTQFIFHTRDGIKYLNVNGVNALTADDLIPSNIGGTDSCGGGSGVQMSAPCGKAEVIFSGGGGIGAKANAVIGKDGGVIAVHMVAGGFGYKTPPHVEIKDPCNIGVGVVARAYLKDVEDTLITYGDKDDFEEYSLCDKNPVGYGSVYDSDGKNTGPWDPRVYTNDKPSQFDQLVKQYQKDVQAVANPWFTTRKQSPNQVASNNKTTKVKYDVTHDGWKDKERVVDDEVLGTKPTFMNTYAISPVPPSNVPGSDNAGVPFTFEWEEEFPYDGEYVFRGQCDNTGSLSLDNDPLMDLAGFKNTPASMKKTITQGLHTIRLDLKNTEQYEKFLDQVARQPSDNKDKVKTETTTTTSSVEAKFLKSGDSKTEFILDVTGKGSAEINFWLFSKDSKTNGLAAEAIKIESDSGEVVLSRMDGKKVIKYANVEKAGTFTGGKKYKVKAEGADSRAGKPRVFDGMIELLDRHKDDTNIRLTMKKIKQKTTTTTTKTVIPPKPTSSTKTDAQTKAVFSTVSHIKKADRKLWRTNVYNRGGFLNEYGVCPFDTKKTIDGNPYAGVHDIVWQNINFPVDGNYDIQVAVDDDVKLEFDGPTKDVIDKQGFQDTRSDGKTGRGFTKGTGPSKYVRYFKKGNYKIKAALKQIPGGDFSFELKKPGPKEAKVTFDIAVGGHYGNQMTIKELGIDVHKAYGGQGVTQSFTKDVEIGKEYEVEFTSIRKRGRQRSTDFRGDAIQLSNNGRKINLEDRLGRKKSTDYKDLITSVNQGQFYDIQGNKAKFRLGKKSSGINPMALGVKITTSFTEKERISKLSWNQNPMGVALTIDSPAPPKPVMPTPIQEGRCPSNPMWSTRFKENKVKKTTLWHPVRFDGWSPFLNKYAMSPVPPLNTPDTDSGGDLFINEWDVEVMHDGWYKLKAEVDDIGKIYVDDDLKVDLSRDAGKIRDEILFPLKNGMSTVKVEVQNPDVSAVRCIDQKIFSTTDWQVKPPKREKEFKDVNFHVKSGTMFASSFSMKDLDISESKPFTPVSQGQRGQINRTYKKSVEVGRVYDVKITSDNDQKGYPIKITGLKAPGDIRKASSTRLEFDDNSANGFDVNASFTIDRVSSGLTAKFSGNGKNLEVSGKKGTVTLTYAWNDRPSISGKSLESIKIGDKTWTQSNDRRGSETFTVSINPIKGIKLRNKGDNIVEMEDHTDNDWTDITCKASIGKFYSMQPNGTCKFIVPPLKGKDAVLADENNANVSLLKGGVSYEGPRLANYGTYSRKTGVRTKDHFISPYVTNSTTPTEEIQGKTWNMKWSGVNFPESGKYKIKVEADDKAIVKVDGKQVGVAEVFQGEKSYEFDATKGNKTVEIVLTNKRIPGTGFKENPVVVYAFIEKKICRNTGVGKPWTGNPIGIAAILIPPPCPRKVKGSGVVDRVEIDDPGGGFDPNPTPDGPDTYPVVPGITTTRPIDPGINYNCATDEPVIEPSYGAELSLCDCGPFGKINKICVDTPGIGVTSWPRIRVKSPTGVNAEFVPGITIIPAELGTPEDMLLQVTDLVGVKQTGYYDGKPYYGSVFYEDGIKYAGWYQTPGAKVQVYDTMQESIDAQVTTPPSAILRSGSDTNSNNPQLRVPGTPENYES